MNIMNKQNRSLPDKIQKRKNSERIQIKNKDMHTYIGIYIHTHIYLKKNIN